MNELQLINNNGDVRVSHRNLAEQKAVPHFKRYIVDGTEVPREYRTQIWSIRQKLLTHV